MRTHRDILAMWPSRSELARRIGLPIPTVCAWWARQSIPADAYTALVEQARKDDLPLTFEELARARNREAAA